MGWVNDVYAPMTESECEYASGSERESAAVNVQDLVNVTMYVHRIA